MLGTLRGSIVNNVWWVIVVTILSTAFGLAVAVLADRAKGENVAKSLIFLPLAISFVGAGVIWTLIYKTAQRHQAPDRPAQRDVDRARRAEQLGLAEVDRVRRRRSRSSPGSATGSPGGRADTQRTPDRLVARRIGVLLVVLVVILLVPGHRRFETVDPAAQSQRHDPRLRAPTSPTTTCG